MSIEEAIKILDYKINMYKEDVFIGDLDKTNIEAIQVVLEEIERLNNDIKELLKENENKEKVIKAQDNIIDKTIEYMERYMFSQKENYDYIHLLGILKGR